MHRDLIIAGVLGALAFTAGASGAAQAQSLGPMRGVVTSMADQFALRLLALNYADRPERYTIRVFNPDFTEIPDARVSVRQVVVGAKGSTAVIVIVPFAQGEAEREVLVCSESEPVFTGQTGMMRGQVCGRYFGRRWR